MYKIEELIEAGSVAVLGAPFQDLLVAKVIASRRARQTQRPTVVRDARTGQEISRYPSPLRKPSGAPPER